MLVVGCGAGDVGAAFGATGGDEFGAPKNDPPLFTGCNTSPSFLSLYSRYFFSKNKQKREKNNKKKPIKLILYMKTMHYYFLTRDFEFEYKDQCLYLGHSA